MSVAGKLDIPFNDKPKQRLKAKVLAPFREKYREERAMAVLPERLATTFFVALTTEDRRFFYVRNSKCGCTTVSQLIHAYVFGRFFEGNIHLCDDIPHGLENWRLHMEALANPDTTRFTIVRHPLDRVRSAFFNFFIDQKNISREQHMGNMAALGLDLEDPLDRNFDRFLDYIEMSFEQSRLYTDRHWRPQVDNIAYGEIDYDFIGKLEFLERDIRQVFERAGAVDVVDRFLTGANFNRSSNRGGDEFEPSPRQLRRIQDFYAEDFDAFGYD